MSQLKPNNFIASITIYIITIKLFELLFDLGKFLTINNNLSNIVFYIISGICGVLSLLVMRILYDKYREDWLYFLIGGVIVMYLLTYFISRSLGEIIGESDFNFEKILLYENIRGYIFISIHIVAFVFYKKLFGKKMR